MSRSLLHDWESSIENLFVEMNKIAEDTYNTAYVRGKNHSNVLEVLDKIRAEIKEKFEGCDICEWLEDYDYEENNISEYQSVGDIEDILQIIDKYKSESEVEE